MIGNPELAEFRPEQADVADVLAALATDAHAGLNSSDAQARLARVGPNALIVSRPVRWWRRLLAQFQSLLVVLLLIATLISAALWLYERQTAWPYEATAIFAIVLLNAVMGFLQQARAEQAVIALRRMSAAQATVIRDGTQRSVPAEELVPGDVILIEEGDTIPADARLIRSIALQTSEAALTGESLPVAKSVEAIAGNTRPGDCSNMVFSGSAAISGRARAVVTSTGMKTELGRIAALLETTPDEVTPLERELHRLGRLLGGIVLVIAAVMITTIVIVQQVRGIAALLDVLILGVALAVAAVPEGLPAIVTAVLALGVQRMAGRNAIVRHLAAVETLGSATVIAADKTGTLTRNEMTVRRVVTASGAVAFSGTGYAPEGDVSRVDGKPLDEPLHKELVRLLTAADRANNAVLVESGGRWTVQGDPTEGALIVAARKAGVDAGILDTRFVRVGEVPFSSERKLMSTIHSDAENSGELLAVTKGAPDVLLPRCKEELVGDRVRPLTQERRQEIAAANEALAGDALRTLAVASRTLPSVDFRNEEFDESVEHQLVFLGLIGMLDPPRDEVRAAVARAARAGIRTLMITGDHPKTAAVIAAELGISADGRTISGAELEQLSEQDLELTLQEVSVYARVNPENKLAIVDALQRGGATVAMTGDGVNDAPALKSADIGIAMGITGTDVSREAADIVLTDDNYASIVLAVEEGRAIFANIRKFLRYLLSSNLGEVMTMFFGVLLAGLIGLTTADSGLVLPLLATQILWINLVTDGAPALALGLDSVHGDVMRAPPRSRAESVITRQMWRGILLVGTIMATGSLLVLDASLPGGLIEGAQDLRHAQTMTFTTMVFFSLFNVFNARSEDRSAFHGLFANTWVWGAVLLSLALQVAVVHLPFLQRAFSTAPLTIREWVLCAVVGSTVLWLVELRKLAGRHFSTASNHESGDNGGSTPLNRRKRVLQVDPSGDH